MTKLLAEDRSETGQRSYITAVQDLVHKEESIQKQEVVAMNEKFNQLDN